jgi:polysaccharide export outer membrane protein
MSLRRTFTSLVLVSGLFLTGCTVLPGTGPESWDVRMGQKDIESLKYSLIQITPHVIDVLDGKAPRLNLVFGEGGPSKEIFFGVGDLVGVTIFETASGGLFIPADAGVRPGNFVALPNQQVDSKGNISIPYAGSIRAKGRTQVEVQQAIVEALKDRAIEPQVVVTLIEQRATLISVLGDVNAPTRFPVNQAGERLLDAIAQAGGPKSQGYEEWVMLERDGRRAVTPFGALVWDTQTNVFVRPGDTIFLYREPQTFLALGATSQGMINFESWRMSLSEALAKAGGLNDSSADAFNIFLYRGEPVEVAKALGIDTASYPGPVVPVIYALNLRDPSGWFLAKKFEMRNKDVIYIPNSPTYEANKAMAFFRQVVGTVNDPVVAALNVYALKAAAGTTAATTVTLVGGAVSGH